MKLLAVPVVLAVGALMAFPVLFANGDAPQPSCTGNADPTRSSPPSEPSSPAATTPPERQDPQRPAPTSSSTPPGPATAATPKPGKHPQRSKTPRPVEHVSGILDAHDGDVTVVPVVWYLGHLPADGSPEWDQVPAPDAGNVLTPREYQARWLAEYDRQLALAKPGSERRGGCLPGGSIGPLADGYAYPGPAELFATAPVDSPHHDYPAWDWGIPVGTPIYAVRGGHVAAVSDFADNWWDHGCDQNSTGCDSCGIGVTIDDDAGNQWTYCHGSAAHVQAGDTIAAGTQILSSGNSGQSTGPHVHLQIRTPDGQLRCPQPLLRSLRDTARGIDPAALPTSGCSY